MVKLMITNGGPHPADKWADTSVETILDLLVDANPNNTSPEAMAARQDKRDLAPKLFAVLLRHHTEVQNHHRDVCKRAKKELLGQPIDVEPHMGGADEVLMLLATTRWASHFAKPEVADAVRQIVGQHTADSIHIERSWHADRLKGL